MTEQTAICSTDCLSAGDTQVVDYGIGIVFLFTTDTALEYLAVSTDSEYILGFERTVILIRTLFNSICTIVIMVATQPISIRSVLRNIIIIIANCTKLK